MSFFSLFLSRNDRILRSSFSTSRDRPSRLGGGGRCRPTSPRVAAASERVTGARAALVAAAAPDTPPRSSDRHLRVEENSSGVTPYTASFGDASRFRAERGVARRAASHRTYPESPKMITFSRVRLRDAMVPGSSRCARGANEGMARALEENDDCSPPSWREGPYPGGLRISSLRGHRALERSSRRRRVKKRRGYPIGDARASSDASPSDASRRSSIPLAE